MTEDLIIRNARAVLPDKVLAGATVRVRHGVIASITSSRETPVPPAEKTDTVDAGGGWLVPGFTDMHIHGLHEHLSQNGADAVAAISSLLPRYGVTGWLPTVCIPLDEKAPAIVAELSAGSDNGAEVLGLHIEGPFLSLGGAVPPEARGGTDADRVRALMDAAGKKRLVFSVSPEFPGISGLIPILIERGSPVFITHTAATVAETEAAIAAGARHATHFYDVFPAPPVTDPGVRPCGAVEAILADSRVTVDFILDGVHVDPVAVRMALQAKGPEGVCLVSDAMIGAGLAPGEYAFGSRPVRFDEAGGPARLVAGGELAGSGLTLDRAVRNAVDWAGIPPPVASRLAGANPARVLGTDDRKGRIAPEYDADLVLLDQNLSVLRTWIGGRTVYPKGIRHEIV